VSVTVGAVYSRSEASVPADPTDTIKDRIRAAKNYVAGEIEPETSALITIIKFSNIEGMRMTLIL
jgi:hypothetical protein